MNGSERQIENQNRVSQEEEEPHGSCFFVPTLNDELRCWIRRTAQVLPRTELPAR